MEQSIFETRQRAEELLRESMAIWRQSDQSEYLEGLEKDPVFSLLITALAYRSNETDNEIERLKNDVTKDLSHLISPYFAGSAMPASVAVETMPDSSVSEYLLDEKTTFTLSNSAFKFMPLLKTRVLNCQVSSVVRLDGRRWQVNLHFKSNTNNLSGFAFAVKSTDYHDLNVSIDNRNLAMVKPTDYADLPLCSCFSLDTLLYNRSLMWQSSYVALDMYARQNVRQYCIKPYQSEGAAASSELSLIFEFTGISDKFVFDKTMLALNSTILVNAELETVNLDSNKPIARISGSNNFSGMAEPGKQFLHLIHPQEEQIFGNVEIDVRRVAADRFNRSSLVKLLNSLINKIDTDYYAFYNIKELNDNKTLTNLREMLIRLQKAAASDNTTSMPGVYLMLKQKNKNQNVSVNISYITSNGSAVNKYLSKTSSFIPSSGLRQEAIKQIADPAQGYDEIQGEEEQKSYVRYFISTKDRIVTPSDIKVFCYNELFVRYAISANLIDNISVGHRQQNGIAYHGYETLVSILIKNTPFVARSFSEKTASAEAMLQNLIAVRTNGIYPVRVTISINKETQN